MGKDNLKPLSLRKEDYVNSIIALTNDSGIPLFVVEYLLRDLLNEVHLAAKKQAEDELLLYKNMINDSEGIVEGDSSENKRG